MIEALTGDTAQIAFYDNAEKIITIPLTLITVLSTVAMPRLANEYKNQNYSHLSNLVIRIAQVALFMACPMVFGIYLVAENFVPWYFGKDFLSVIKVLYILAPIIIANSIEGIYGKQYLTAINKTKLLTVTYSITACFNFVLNLLFIPKYGFIGAAVVTLISSFFAITIQFFFVYKQLEIKLLLQPFIKYMFASITMFIISSKLSNFVESGVLKTIIQVISSFIIYLLILSVLNYKLLLNIIKNRSII